MAVAGLTDTATGVAGAGQVPLSADAGAEVVAAVVLITTCAVSVRPASSVTVTWIVMGPELGATTVADALFAPCMAIVPEPTALHI